MVFPSHFPLFLLSSKRGGVTRRRENKQNKQNYLRPKRMMIQVERSLAGIELLKFFLGGERRVPSLSHKINARKKKLSKNGLRRITGLPKWPKKKQNS